MECLNKMVTFDKRHEGGKGMSPMGSWEERTFKV